MKYGVKKISTAAVLAGLGLAALSPAVLACTPEPYTGSVCVLASPRFAGGISNVYVMADGRQMNIGQNAALYSILGVTFGGNGSTYFNLPDLRGKVIMGHDPRQPALPVGFTGGAASTKLTLAQLPAQPVAVTVSTNNFSTVTATTSLAGLAATANLAGVKITGPATGLTIKAASNNTTNVGSPENAYLAKSGGPQGNVYTTAAPNVTLNSGSIAGDLTLTVGTGVTAPVNISATGATTTLGGQLTLAGTTSALGAGADVPTMPPYMVLPYFIAVSGIYPSMP